MKDMGWQKGVKRGPRKKFKNSNGADISLEDALSGVDPEMKTMSAEEAEAEVGSDVCPIEELPEWGLSFDSRNIIVMKRRKFEADEKIAKIINGETIVIEYKAGDYGEWIPAQGTGKGPFYGTLAHALLYIHKRDINNKIIKQGVVKNLADIIADSERRIMKTIKA